MTPFLQSLNLMLRRPWPNHAASRTQAICLALAILLLCPLASGQLVQTNELNDRQVPQYPLMGTKAFRATPREFSGLPTQHRVQTDFKSRLDSLRASRVQSPLPGGKVIPNGIQTSRRPQMKISSPQSQIYVIDTAIVRATWDTTRHLYSFNAKAKRTTDLMQNLRGGLWVDTLRETDTYDANGNRLSELDEYRSNGQWLGNYRRTYTYDATNNMLSALFELFEYWSNGQWVGDNRQTYTYDASNNMLSELSEGWSNGQWVGDNRQTYTYDASNNMLSELGESWSNGQWAGNYRQTYAYDASNNMLSELHESWSNGQWVGDNRQTYTYDASDNKLSELDEFWSNGQWVGYNRRTYTYDASNNKLSELDEFWSNGQWVNSERYTFTYDANEHMLSQLYETWSSGQWENSNLRAQTYDLQGNLTSFGNYSWMNSVWTPSDIGGAYRGAGYSLSDSAGNRYRYTYPVYSITLVYRFIVTGVASQGGIMPEVYSLSQNYPNPFNPSTLIRYTIPGSREYGVGSKEVKLAVYDILGREVAVLVNEKKAPGSYEMKFDASGLASGVYLYRLTAGSFVQSRTMLLLK